MTKSTVLPIWYSIRDQFQNMAVALPEDVMDLQLGTTSIGWLLYHTSEVEYMFTEWFFGKSIPTDMEKPSLTSLKELTEMLINSNKHLIEAMQDLSEEEWLISKESPMGVSTPIEAIGRLMYHTGIHAGQISLIQKNAVPVT